MILLLIFTQKGTEKQDFIKSKYLELQGNSRKNFLNKFYNH